MASIKELADQAKKSRLGTAISNVFSQSKSKVQSLNSPEVQQRRNNFNQSLLSATRPVGSAALSFGKTLTQPLTDVGTGSYQFFKNTGSNLQGDINAVRGIQRTPEQIQAKKNFYNAANKIMAGGVKTALTFAAPLAGKAAVLSSAGIGAGLGAAQAALSKQNVSQGIGKGAAEGVQYAGLNKLTSPVIDPAAKFIGGKTGQLATILKNGKNVKVRDLAIAQKIGKFLGVAAGQGLGNVAEDELYARLAENRTPTTGERVGSFALGSLFAGLQNGDILFEKGLFRNKAGQLFDPVSGKFTAANKEVKARQKKYILSVIEPNDQNMMGGMRLEPAAKSRIKNPESGFIDPTEITNSLLAKQTKNQPQAVPEIPGINPMKQVGDPSQQATPVLNNLDPALNNPKILANQSQSQTQLKTNFGTLDQSAPYRTSSQTTVIENPELLKQGRGQKNKLLPSSNLSYKDDVLNGQQSKLQQTSPPVKEAYSQSASINKSSLESIQQKVKLLKAASQNMKLRAELDQVGTAVSGGTSGKIITKDAKYSYNINKPLLGLNKQQSKQLDSVVETMRPVLEKNKGKKLSKTEIIEGGRKANLLGNVIGREEAKQFAESLQASRNFLRTESKQVGITPQFLDQLEIVSSTAADAGRRLQAFSVAAEDATIKEKVVRDILKIGTSAKEVLEAGQKVDWNNADEITAFYRKFKPATLAERLDEYRYTNMLSSPNTHITNVFSNFIQTALLAPVEKSVRGSFDYTYSRMTGKEQEYFASQGIDYAKGYWRSLPDAWKALKGAFGDGELLTKPDVNLIPTSTSRIRKLYTLPLTALEATDQFFRTLTKGGVVESLKKQGVSGAEATKIAEQEADYRTFRQAFDPEGKFGQNEVLEIWDKWNVAIQSLRNVPGGKYLVPFLQTPTNILKQGVEYSPLGFSTIKGSSDPMGQLAKSMIGTGIFASSYALAESGLTTWDTPTNANDRAEFYAAGLQPYSIKIGDKWVSYSKLGPLSYPIAMAAALKWAADNHGDEGALKTAGMSMAGTLGFFADQSYVRGIGDIIDAIRGDEYKQARGLSNIPAQMIPYRSFMGWVSRLIDPVYRKTSGGTIPEQIGKSIISQVPVASRNLEAYQTPFGTDSVRQFPGINAISPLTVSQEKPLEKTYYDARSKNRLETRKVNKVIKDIESGKPADTNKILSKQAIDITKKKVQAGLTVAPNELEAAYLESSLKLPKSNRYEKSQRDSSLYSSYNTIQSNEDLSTEQKQVLTNRIAQELGKTPQDLQIYSVAKEDNDSKTLYAYDQFDKMSSFDDRMRYLVNGRRPINGKILVSDGVIDNLVADGLIPEALGDDIKDIDLKEDGTLKTGTKASSSKKALQARLSATNDYFDNLKKIKIGTSTTSKETQAQRINTKNLTFSGA